MVRGAAVDASVDRRGSRWADAARRGREVERNPLVDPDFRARGCRASVGAGRVKARARGGRLEAAERLPAPGGPRKAPDSELSAGSYRPRGSLPAAARGV